jgi:HEPN domain-containing protein
LQTAELLFANGRYAHCCFHAQQAGEKALKALWYAYDGDPWGHSIKKLIEEFAELDSQVYKEIKGLARAGIILDRYYIPTRYPNGLPDVTPDMAFFEEDGQTALDLSRSILENIYRLIDFCYQP